MTNFEYYYHDFIDCANIMAYLSYLYKHYTDNEDEIIDERKIFRWLGEEYKPKMLKPYLEGDGYADGAIAWDIWRCPNCDTAYDYDDKYNYCPECGQRIDWIEHDE